MDYKKMLQDLKNEINELKSAEEIKSPLLKIETILSHLYRDVLEQEEEKIRLRINKYIEHRTTEIVNGNTPIKLEDESKLIIHVIPFNAFKFESHMPEINIDLNNPSEVKPLYVSSWNPVVNENGIISSLSDYGYVQLYKSGIIEAVDLSMLSYQPTPIKALEKEILIGLERYQKILQETNLKGKLLISIKLTKAKNKVLSIGEGYFINRKSLDNDNYSLTPVVLDDINDSLEQKMKSAFDHLWRLVGYPESKSYNNGVFVR
jgi:hypothetical protein